MEKWHQRVEDVEAARAGAHAEKPFREALMEGKYALSDEAKKALDFIASAEGEKAIKNYQEMNESAKEAFLDKIRPGFHVSIATMKDKWRFFPPDTGPNAVTAAMSHYGEMALQKIISGGGTTEEKLRSIQSVVPSLWRGYSEIQERTNKMSDAKAAEYREHNPLLSLGEKVMRVARGKVELLDLNTDLTLANQLHQAYLDDNPHTNFAGARLDSFMAENGYKWNEKVGEYVKLEL